MSSYTSVSILKNVVETCKVGVSLLFYCSTACTCSGLSIAFGEDIRVVFNYMCQSKPIPIPSHPHPYYGMTNLLSCKDIWFQCKDHHESRRHQTPTVRVVPVTGSFMNKHEELLDWQNTDLLLMKQQQREVCIQN